MIPIAVREKFAILPDTEVEFGERGNKITIEKAKPKKGKLSRGERIVARMIGKGTANTDLMTGQIMAWTRGLDDIDDPDRWQCLARHFLERTGWV